MRALLVHNPTAGTKGHDRDSIVDALQLADYKVDYVSPLARGQEKPDLRYWRRGMVIGTPEAVGRMCN